MKNKKTSRLNSLAILGLLLAWPAASFAQLKVEVLDTVKVQMESDQKRPMAALGEWSLRRPAHRDSCAYITW